MSHIASSHIASIAGLAMLGILAGLVWCMEREAAEQQRKRAQRLANVRRDEG